MVMALLTSCTYSFYPVYPYYIEEECEEYPFYHDYTFPYYPIPSSGDTISINDLYLYGRLVIDPLWIDSDTLILK